MKDNLLLALTLAKKNGGGGVISYNDLTDKPCGLVDVYIVPEQVPTLGEIEGTPVLFIELSHTPVANETYAINWGGTIYNCNAVYDPSMDGFIMGNLAMMGMEDTGEPFILEIQDGQTLLIPLTEDIPNLISVYGKIMVKLPFDQVDMHPLLDLISVGMETIDASLHSHGSAATGEIDANLASNIINWAQRGYVPKVRVNVKAENASGEVPVTTIPTATIQELNRTLKLHFMWGNTLFMIEVTTAGSVWCRTHPFEGVTL